MKSESFKVAGVTRYEENIRTVLRYNRTYDLSSKEIKELYSNGSRVKEYIPDKMNVVLEPEPDNRFDSNAVKVLINGTKVGYIKEGSCTHVKNLLKKEGVKVVVTDIGIGKYKDIDDGRVEKGAYNYPFVKLAICYPDPEENAKKDPVAPSKAQTERAAAIKKSKTRLTIFAVFVWIVLSALSHLIDPAIVLGVIMVILVSEVFKRFK